MNEDFPWFLVAMVVIAFLRWVVLKIQGRSATDAFDETLFAEDEEELRKSQGTIANRSDPTIDPNEEIKKFFEALGGGAQTETAPPPPRRAAPPPLPAAKKAPPPVKQPPPAVRRPKTPPALSAAEQEALQRIRDGGAQPTRQRRARARGRTGGAVSFRDLVAHPDSLKTAVILKEILDEPKGLHSLRG